MLWQPLETFRDPAIPKLDNLRRADRAGLVVPPTWWAWANRLERGGPPPMPGPPGLAVPCIVRSGSPTEDTATGSNAGRFLSVEVREAAEFPDALARVVGALPTGRGRRLGVVFVQPIIQAVTAGVTFFDGFYYEETSAASGNGALTSGRQRGEVRRGHVQRDDPRTDWLGAVHRVFGGRIDLEWAQPARGDRVLLQVRPALFPIRRDFTLSLANHKEILGDPPSPWATGMVVECAGAFTRHFQAVEPVVAGWDEPYTVELAERPWLNLSAFFRLMDHWGLPRTMVTAGVGGQEHGPADARIVPPRFVRQLPALVRIALHSLATMARAPRRLRELDAALDRAGSLQELQRLNVRAFDVSIRTNIAIIQVLAVSGRLRRLFGRDQAARVVTHRMMARYAALAARPTVADRLAGLDAWLARYGHRGPLESDLSRPRFAELRPALEAGLRRGAAPAPKEGRQPSVLAAALARPLFLADEVREWFRDRLMRRWHRLRVRVLAEARRAVEAGHLDAAEDVFFLRSADLAADPATWRNRVERRRASWRRAARLVLPTTAGRDQIEALAARAGEPGLPNHADRFAGIGLGSGPVVGTAVRATAVEDLLDGRPLPETPVLVADTLEPSWAVVFPRFAAVVADLGGELSHAAILLREAGIPSVLNARGAFAGIADGDRVRLDPGRGEVVVEVRTDRAPPADPPPLGLGLDYLYKAC